MFQLKIIRHTLFMIAAAGIISSMPDTTQAHTVILAPVDVESIILSVSQAHNEIPTKVVLPTLNIEMDVTASKVEAGTWEVPEDSAGYGIGSSFLDDPFGNSIIFAHARPGLFRTLPNISIGDEIIVHGNENHIYTYKIISKEKIYPNEINKIISKGGHHLTLFTCEGYMDEYRHVVKAIRVSKISSDITTSQPIIEQELLID